jgi:DNA-binding helix-hairpin-helix protein with protein kinase domain
MPQKLFKLMHRCERDGLAGNLRFDVLLRIAAAAAGIAGHLHHHSVVIGDVNEVNAMTSCDGWTTWIDADSMQFADAAGNLHLSPYHRIEHLAPEFAGIDLARVPRTVASDDYAIAVLVFQLLMDGFHPFDAVDRLASSGDGQADRARSGLFAYDGSAHSIGPPLGAPSWDAVPDAVQAALKQTFAAGIQHPDARTRSWQLHHALLTGSGS